MIEKRIKSGIFVPVSGLKKALKPIFCAIFSVLMAAALIYSGYTEHLAPKENQSAQPPSAPPVLEAPHPEHLPSGSLSDDDDIWAYTDIFFENELPGALGVYDQIFSDSNGTDAVEGELKIISTDLSKNPAAGTVYIKNNTEYKINVSELLTLSANIAVPPYSLTDPAQEPKVLIYHTHGTEGYAEEGKASYKKKNLPRSTDITKNVVAVGKVLSDTLNSLGIPTIHCEIMHDKNDYNNAYNNSRKTLVEYLKKYPSIEYVFDLHRDALHNDTYVYKTVTYDQSTPVAQIMLVVGTDSAGAVHPNWRKNLSFAVDLQYLLTNRLENLVRPICLKDASYLQQYCEGGMLIEVGTCVNTLNEAKASAVILGRTLAGLIRQRDGVV